MGVRRAESGDSGSIRALYLSAFPPEESELVANLAVALMSDEPNRPNYTFVAEDEGRIVGHIAFSPVFSTPERNDYNLSPLAVQPDFQKQGIGSALIRHGLDALKQDSVEAVLVYGDPAYYSRFGFEQKLAENFIPPYELKFPFGWQALFISGGAQSASISVRNVSALDRPDFW